MQTLNKNRIGSFALRKQKIEQLYQKSISRELYNNKQTLFEILNDKDQYIELSDTKVLQNKFTNSFISIKYKIDKQIHNYWTQQDQQTLQDPKLYTSIADIKQFILEKPINKNVAICCELDNLEQVQQYVENSHNRFIGNIMILCLQQSLSQKQQTEFKSITKPISNYEQYCEQIKTLSVQLRKVNNFSIICLDTTYSIKKFLTLNWLLFPQNYKQSYRDIIQVLKSSQIVNVQSSQAQRGLQDFINDFQNLQTYHNYSKILRWYTCQTFFYKILNITTKIFNNATELGYFRYIYSMVFRSIQQLYFQQIKSNLLDKQFVCYRGTNLHQKQILYLKNSINQYIQLESFMSTSIEQSQVKRFGNSTIIINVPPYKPTQYFDPGYALIHDYSFFKNQKQVVFNPLNYFKIKDVSYKSDKTNHQIELQYVSINQIDKHQNSYFVTCQSMLKECYDQGSLMAVCRQKKAIQWYDNYLVNVLFKKWDIVNCQKVVIDFPHRILNQLTIFLQNKFRQHYKQYIQLLNHDFWVKIAYLLIYNELIDQIRIIKYYALCLQQQDMQGYATLFNQVHLQIMLIKLSKQCNHQIITLKQQICQYLIKIMIVYGQPKLHHVQQLIRLSSQTNCLYFKYYGEYFRIKLMKMNSQLQSAYKLYIGLKYRTNEHTSIQIMQLRMMIILQLIQIREQFNQETIQLIQQYEQICRNNQLMKNLHGFTNNMNRLGCFYMKHNKYSKSLQIFQQLDLIYQYYQMTSSQSYSKLLFNISLTYLNMTNYNKAKQYLKLAQYNYNQQILQKQRLKYFIDIHHYLSIVYECQNNLQQQLKQLISKLSLQFKIPIMGIQTQYKIITILNNKIQQLSWAQSLYYTITQQYFSKLLLLSDSLIDMQQQIHQQQLYYKGHNQLRDSLIQLSTFIINQIQSLQNLPIQYIMQKITILIQQSGMTQQTTQNILYQKQQKSIYSNTTTISTQKSQLVSKEIQTSFDGQYRGRWTQKHSPIIYIIKMYQQLSNLREQSQQVIIQKLMYICKYRVLTLYQIQIVYHHFQTNIQIEHIIILCMNLLQIKYNLDSQRIWQIFCKLTQTLMQDSQKCVSRSLQIYEKILKFYYGYLALNYEISSLKQVNISIDIVKKITVYANMILKVASQYQQLPYRNKVILKTSQLLDCPKIYTVSSKYPLFKQLIQKINKNLFVLESQCRKKIKIIKNRRQL